MKAVAAAHAGCLLGWLAGWPIDWAAYYPRKFAPVEAIRTIRTNIQTTLLFAYATALLRAARLHVHTFSAAIAPHICSLAVVDRALPTDCGGHRPQEALLRARSLARRLASRPAKKINGRKYTVVNLYAVCYS